MAMPMKTVHAITRLIVALSCLLLATVTGCVSIPDEQLSRPIQTEELSDHVYFLAQPALKGRKPKTMESATARRYIKTRFQQYGLVPWADAKGFEQPFGYGTNVVGLLQGSDPDLGDQIIIVAAHYDHVGKTKKGVCRGACDNAAGVAALLEIAEHLISSPNRPKRTVCFAAFDCEETFTLGSFVFTCRDDFESQKIAAVVNIDLLGRDFLDVVNDSLFVVGSQLYPQTQADILSLAAQNHITALPIGTDLVGPRGDHVAFETLEIPVLFFSCGLYKDYHRPTDTPDKLNYPKMRNSVNVIAETVRALANADQIEKPAKSEHADKQELHTLIHLLEAVNAKPDQAGLKPEQAEKLPELLEKTRLLLGEKEYTLQMRRRFAGRTIKALLPSLTPVENVSPEQAQAMFWTKELYTTHRRTLTEGFRELVRHLLENKPSLFRKINFEYQAYNIADDELSFVETDDGEYELDVILTKIKLDFQTNGSLFNRPSFGLAAEFSNRHFLGSCDQATSFCLLQWRKNLEEPSYSCVWQRVLTTVTQTDQGNSYDQWMQWLLNKHGWASESKWIASLHQSDNPRIRSIFQKDKVTERRFAFIMTDPNTPVATKMITIRALTEGADQLPMLEVVDVLKDPTPTEAIETTPRFMEDSYPFADHPVVQMMREVWEKQIMADKQQATLADEAEKKLKQLTGKDFGKDARAWRKWITSHMK